MCKFFRFFFWFVCYFGDLVGFVLCLQEKFNETFLYKKENRSCMDVLILLHNVRDVNLNINSVVSKIEHWLLFMVFFADGVYSYRLLNSSK